MLKEIVSNYGILQSIISERNKLLTSKFWNTWTRQLDTKVKLFTAYHPQADRKKDKPDLRAVPMTLHQFQAKQLNRFATLSTVCIQQPTT